MGDAEGRKEVEEREGLGLREEGRRERGSAVAGWWGEGSAVEG